MLKTTMLLVVVGVGLTGCMIAPYDHRSSHGHTMHAKHHMPHDVKDYSSSHPRPQFNDQVQKRQTSSQKPSRQMKHSSQQPPISHDQRKRREQNQR